MDELFARKIISKKILVHIQLSHRRVNMNFNSRASAMINFRKDY